MPHGIPDTRQFPWDRALANHLGQLMHPTYGGLTTVTTRPTVGVDGLALGAEHRGYTVVNTGTANIEQWDGTAWVPLIDSAKLVKTASIDFYVNQTTGSDNNTGLSVNSPWKTPTKLYQEMLTYNFLDSTVNIYLGAGTYNIELPLNTQYLKVNIIGAGSSVVKLGPLTIKHQQHVSIKGLTLSTPDFASSAIVQYMVVRGHSFLHVGPDVVLGDCGSSVVYFNGQGTVYLYPNCPLTVTHDCYRLFSMSGMLMFMRYLSFQPWDGLPYQPITVPALTSADTVCKVNFVGTLRTIQESVFHAESGGSIVGYQNMGSCQVTGTTSNALAYILYTNGFLSLNTIVGNVTANRTLGFPSTVRQGFVDPSSPTAASLGVVYNI